MVERIRSTKHRHIPGRQRRRTFIYKDARTLLAEKIERIAWCRRRVAEEMRLLEKLLAEHPELRAPAENVQHGPVLVVDNTRRVGAYNTGSRRQRSGAGMGPDAPDAA